MMIIFVGVGGGSGGGGDNDYDDVGVHNNQLTIFNQIKMDFDMT